MTNGEGHASQPCEGKGANVNETEAQKSLVSEEEAAEKQDIGA